MMFDGPIPIMLRNSDGELTEALAPGVHYNVTEALMAEHPELEVYRVSPPVLQRVWAGDKPEDAAWTVPLRFDTESEAREALAAWWTPDA